MRHQPSPPLPPPTKVPQVPDNILPSHTAKPRTTKWTAPQTIKLPRSRATCTESTDATATCTRHAGQDSCESARVPSIESTVKAAARSTQTESPDQTRYRTLGSGVTGSLDGDTDNQVPHPVVSTTSAEHTIDRSLVTKARHILSGLVDRLRPVRRACVTASAKSTIAA